MENWELSPEGGVRKRKGFNRVADVGSETEGACTCPSEHARIFPYLYSHAEEGGRYVIGVTRMHGETRTLVQVFATDGALEAELNGGEYSSVGNEWQAWLPDLPSMRVKQVNSHLFLLSKNERPWVLKRDNAGSWTLEEWKYKHYPWHDEPGDDKEDFVTVEVATVQDSQSSAGLCTRTAGSISGAQQVNYSSYDYNGGPAVSMGQAQGIGFITMHYYTNPYSDQGVKEYAGARYLIQTSTRYPSYNAAAYNEISSALTPLGMAPTFASSYANVPGLAQHRRNLPNRLYSMMQQISFSILGALGSEVTIYMLCENDASTPYGGVSVMGMKDVRINWASPNGSGFDLSYCPRTAAGQLHLLRIVGTPTTSLIHVQHLESCLWTAVVRKSSTSHKELHVGFENVNDTSERASSTPQAREDYLRISYFTEQQTAKSNQSELLGSRPDAYGTSQQLYVINTASHNASWTCAGGLRAGARIAILESPSNSKPVEVYSCIQTFPHSSFVPGLVSPSNYPSHFAKSTLQKPPSGATSWYLFTLESATSDIQKNIYVCQYMQNWRYYTCIKDIPAGTVFPEGPENASGYFAKGTICGNAMPCRGPWSSYTSGVWYGEYAVKRNYDTSNPFDERWETLARTTSRAGAPTNKIISGDEKNQECYLSLWLISSRCFDSNEASPSLGFPGDSSENQLIVESYRRDLVLTLRGNDDGSTSWVLEADLPEWDGAKRIYDWSWWAFSPRYGGPTSCDVYAQRLVFAGTHGQPQTLWMSKTNDIDNFQTGSDDADALSLTLSTTSQNPICWLQSKGDILLLGTSEAEYSISSRAGGIFTAATVQARPQSYIGSADTPCIQADNRVLFLQRGRKRLYEIGYDFETDGYISRDLTLMASHIGRDHGGFVRGALAKVPYTTAYIVMGDGSLALLAYNPLENIKGWHRWTGFDEDYRVTSDYLDVCVLPSDDGDDLIFALYYLNVPGVKYKLLLYNDSNNAYPYRDTYASNVYGYPSSVLSTLPLNHIMSQAADKRNSATVKIRLGDSFTPGDVDCFMLSKDEGATSFRPDRSGTLHAGWHDLKAPGGWREDETITITLGATNQGMHILALQS